MNQGFTLLVLLSLSSYGLGMQFPNVQFRKSTSEDRKKFRESSWLTPSCLRDIKSCISLNHFEFKWPNGETTYYVVIMKAIPKDAFKADKYFFVAFTEGLGNRFTHLVSLLNPCEDVIKEGAMNYLDFFGDEFDQGSYCDSLQAETIIWKELTQVRSKVLELLGDESVILPVDSTFLHFHSNPVLEGTKFLTIYNCDTIVRELYYSKPTA